MPTRKTVFENGNFYHILNRSIQNIPIFSESRQCEIFLKLLKFYNCSNPPGRFSVNRDLEIVNKVKQNEQIVNIVNYCLMPNHFHLTLMQKSDHGVITFMQRVLNSFSHFYNIKYKNIGPLFQGNFKSIEVETTEQLLHLSRYIHLNPVTSYLVENPEDYKFSSYRTYIGLENSDLIDSKPVLSEFKSPEKYQKFVMLQKDYQRKIGKIKQILLERI